VEKRKNTTKEFPDSWATANPKQSGKEEEYPTVSPMSTGRQNAMVLHLTKVSGEISGVGDPHYSAPGEKRDDKHNFRGGEEK